MDNETKPRPSLIEQAHGLAMCVFGLAPPAYDAVSIEVRNQSCSYDDTEHCPWTAAVLDSKDTGEDRKSLTAMYAGKTPEEALSLLIKELHVRTEALRKRCVDALDASGD